MPIDISERFRLGGKPYKMASRKHTEEEDEEEEEEHMIANPHLVPEMMKRLLDEKSENI